MPVVPNRGGGTPNESIQPANALGKLVIGSSSTPAAPDDQQPSGSQNQSPSQSAASGAAPASAFSSALKQVSALAQSALGAASSAPGGSPPPVGNWSQASPDLASALQSARTARAADPSSNVPMSDVPTLDMASLGGDH